MSQNFPPNGYRSAQNLSHFVISGLALIGLSDILSAFLGLGHVLSPEMNLDLDEDGTVSLWMMLQGLVALLKFPLFIGTVVVFLIWTSRSVKNLVPLRGQNLTFSPGWAVGWWFIPFANLWKPFQAMREIWSESDPSYDGEPMFLGRTMRSAPNFMVAWWALWILSNVLSNVTSLLFDVDSSITGPAAGYAFLITGVASTAAAVFAIKVVRDVTQRQDARSLNIASHEQYAPPPPPEFRSFA